MAVVSEYVKPEHAAPRSNPHAFRAPIFACTMQAVLGKIVSGVVVPTTMNPTWAGVMRASFNADSTACTARSDVATPGSAMCRSRMPVRCRIHSLLVSTIFSRSAFVSTRGGTNVARPAIFTGRRRQSRINQCSLLNVQWLNALPETRVALDGRQPEVLVGLCRGHAASRRPVEEPDLDQERLVDILERVPLLAHRRGKAAHANRPPVEFIDDRAEQAPIDLVEAVLVHFEHRERTRGHVRSDAPVGAHLRVIAHTAQEPVGNARCATGSPRDLPRGIGV